MRSDFVEGPLRVLDGRRGDIGRCCTEVVRNAQAGDKLGCPLGLVGVTWIFYPWRLVDGHGAVQPLVPLVLCVTENAVVVHVPGDGNTVSHNAGRPWWPRR